MTRCRHRDVGCGRKHVAATAEAGVPERETGETSLGLRRRRPRVALVHDEPPLAGVDMSRLHPGEPGARTIGDHDDVAALGRGDRQGIDLDGRDKGIAVGVGPPPLSFPNEATLPRRRDRDRYPGWSSLDRRRPNAITTNERR